MANLQMPKRIFTKMKIRASNTNDSTKLNFYSESFFFLSHLFRFARCVRSWFGCCFTMTQNLLCSGLKCTAHYTFVFSTVNLLFLWSFTWMLLILVTHTHSYYWISMYVHWTKYMLVEGTKEWSTMLYNPIKSSLDR